MSPHRNPRNPHASQAFRALRARALLPIIAAALLCFTARAADHKSAPPANSAATYPANDTHPGERLTIAADPCDDPRLCAFFRLPYIQHGLLPIRVILTNDGDRALQLDDARFQFISAAGDTLPAATEEDINRRLFTLKSTQPIHIPLIPFPIKRTPIDKRIAQDDNDFGFQGTIVNAHSTLAGYLFYDVKGLDDPALAHASLYVKMVHTLDGKQELFAFTIPFDIWLAANPNAPSNHPRK
jgi:hypothetical protein